MKHRTNIILIALTLAITHSLLLQPIYAQNCIDVNWPSPLFDEQDIKPGDELSGEVTVINESGEDPTLGLYATLICPECSPSAKQEKLNFLDQFLLTISDLTNPQKPIIVYGYSDTAEYGNIAKNNATKNSNNYFASIFVDEKDAIIIPTPDNWTSLTYKLQLKLPSSVENYQKAIANFDLNIACSTMPTSTPTPTPTPTLTPTPTPTKIDDGLVQGEETQVSSDGEDGSVLGVLTSLPSTGRQILIFSLFLSLIFCLNLSLLCLREKNKA